MKKLKSLLLSLSIVFFIACGDDDYSIAYVDTETKTEVIATVESSLLGVVPGTVVPITVTFDSAFPSESTVTVKAENANNSSAKTGTAVLAAGATSAKVMVEIPANGSPSTYTGLDDIVKIYVDGVKLTEGDDPYVATSNMLLMPLFDETGWDAPYPVDYCSSSAPPTLPGLCDDVVEPWLVYNLDWEGAPSNDLDIFVYTGPGKTGDRYEYSWSYSRFEGDYFNGNWNPDGVYYLTIEPWQAGPVEFRITIIDYDGTMHQKVGTISDSVLDIATITKSGGTTNDITYDIEWLID